LLLNSRQKLITLDISEELQRLENQTAGDADDPWTNPSWASLLIAMPWLIGSIALMWGAIANHNVAAREKTITGAITAHEAANHNTYLYTFAIEGKAYTGRQIPDKQELAVGQQVRVYYDPQDPAKNSLIDFDEVALGNLGPASFAFWLSAAAIVFVIVQRRKSHRRASGRND
jgi:uncharacterized protein DUF3592